MKRQVQVEDGGIRCGACGMEIKGLPINPFDDRMYHEGCLERRVARYRREHPNVIGMGIAEYREAMATSRQARLV